MLKKGKACANESNSMRKGVKRNLRGSWIQGSKGLISAWG